MTKKELIFILICLFSINTNEIQAQINSADDALKMYSTTKKQDSSKVRFALEEWLDRDKNNPIPYLFLIDYNIIQNIVLLQDYKNMFEEEQEILFERRVKLVEDYILDAKRLSPNSLDVHLCALYAAYMVLSEEKYQAFLLEIIQFNKNTDFDWLVLNPYKLSIDYHQVLMDMEYENTSQNKFLYWFFIWGQNNLRNFDFLPYERTERIIDFTTKVLLQAYPNSLHVYLLLFQLYKDLDKEHTALSFLQKAVDIFPNDFNLKLIFAAESFNSLSSYEMLFPFRLKANEQLGQLIENCKDEVMVNRAKELKAMLFSDKE